jgi:preprotein translocase subunit SecA
MLTALLHKVFGSKNDRELKKLRPIVAQANSIEQELSTLSLTELRAKTDTFKARIAGSDSGVARTI